MLKLKVSLILNIVINLVSEILKASAENKSSSNSYSPSLFGLIKSKFSIAFSKSKLLFNFFRKTFGMLLSFPSQIIYVPISSFMRNILKNERL